MQSKQTGSNNQQEVSETRRPATNSGRKSNFSWGWLAVIALPVICCGGPLILAALSVAGSGIASTLGLGWPLVIGVGLLIAAVLVFSRLYLRRQRRSRNLRVGGSEMAVNAPAPPTWVK